MRLALALSLVLLPVSGRAQVSGLPVVTSAATRGWSAGAALGLPNATAGGGHVVAAEAGYVRPRWGVAGTLGWRDPASSDAQLAVAALGWISLTTPETTPFRFRLFVGAGRSEHDNDSEWRVPAGAELKFAIITPLVSFAPFVAPRIQYVDGVGAAATHAAFAAGLDLELLSGIGARIGYDQALLEGEDESSFSFGLFYSFSPGL